MFFQTTIDKSAQPDHFPRSNPTRNESPVGPLSGSQRFSVWQSTTGFESPLSLRIAKGWDKSILSLLAETVGFTRMLRIRRPAPLLRGRLAPLAIRQSTGLSQFTLAPVRVRIPSHQMRKEAKGLFSHLAETVGFEVEVQA